jgi:hypothetical protein
LLEATIASIEARDDLAAALAARRLGVDQSLQLIAPFRTLIGAATARK